jgi:hypothetical protein
MADAPIHERNVQTRETVARASDKGDYNTRKGKMKTPIIGNVFFIGVVSVMGGEIIGAVTVDGPDPRTV